MKRYVLIIMIFLMAITVKVYSDEKIEKLKEVLDLSESQVNKIKDLLFYNQSNKEKYIIKLKKKHLELKEILVESDIPSKDVVRSKLEEIAAIEIEIRMLRFNLDIEILKILNEEQKKKYKYFRISKKKDL